MSSAIIRSNLLAELASIGAAAMNEINRKVREFLADEPGPWLREEYGSPAELLERSILNATEEGKRLLLRAVSIVIDEAFSELKVRSLSNRESRQLLGAIGIAARHPNVSTAKLSTVLFLGIHHPTIFWRRVEPISDIVGRESEQRDEFLSLLWAKLPPDDQTLTDRLERITRSEFARRADLLASSLPSERAAVASHLLRGQLVRIEITINGVLRTFGLLRLISNDDFLFSNQDIDELEVIFAKSDIPVAQLGNVRVTSESNKTIANAIGTRLQIWLIQPERHCLAINLRPKNFSWKPTKQERDKLRQLV